MLKVSVRSISITDIGFVVFLKSEVRKDVLPIFIGPVEAQAISMILTGNNVKRPMTHDLIKTVIERTDYKISKIQINKIEAETYFASLYLFKKRILKKAHKEIIIDARPSDAIALAIRFNCPIYVAASLFDEQGLELNEVLGGPFLKRKRTPTSKRVFKMGVPKKTNDELGVYKEMLEEAIKDERFEDASKIRDKIETMMQNKLEN